MNTAFIFTRRANILLGTFLAVAFLLAPLTIGQESIASFHDGSTAGAITGGEESPTTTVKRIGKLYTTIVERKTEGELSKEDFQQVSLLGTRVIKDLNGAAEHLIDEHHDEATCDLEHARTLVKVIRDILPVTIVDTVVKKVDGEEIYRNTDRVQDDLIPIFESRVAIEVMEPILDAKKDTAAVKGIRLADADLIHTSVLLDLGYVERKVRRCLSLMNEKPDRALAQPSRRTTACDCLSTRRTTPSSRLRLHSASRSGWSSKSDTRRARRT